MACVAQMKDGIWFDGPRVMQEEYNYQVYLAQQNRGQSATTARCPKTEPAPSSCVAQQIAQARERIHQTLQGTATAVSVDASAKLQKCESDNSELRKLIDSLIHRMSALEARLGKLEAKETTSEVGKAPPAQKGPTPAKQTSAESESDDDDSDDDEDLFGSDESEDEEMKKQKEERLAAYHAKKAKKPAVIAKSNIILDVKPWDDTTDMADLEKEVRAIQTDGLVWGPSKLLEVAYGIKKLQISCVVEDDKVGTDYLEEKITDLEDLVQSMDVVAFNKV